MIIEAGMIEMHISESDLPGHSASGVFVMRMHAPLLMVFTLEIWRACPMLGAFTNGMVAGEDAIDFVKEIDFAEYDEAMHAEKERVLAPTLREDGIPLNQLEYKTRRLVNDYLQPPKVTRKCSCSRRFAETRNDRSMVVTKSLMRSLKSLQ